MNSSDGASALSVWSLQVLQGLYARSTGQVDDRWVGFMKYQIERARKYFKDSEDGVNMLDKNARYPVWYVSLPRYIL